MLGLKSSASSRSDLIQNANERCESKSMWLACASAKRPSRFFIRHPITVRCKIDPEREGMRSFTLPVPDCAIRTCICQMASSYASVLGAIPDPSIHPDYTSTNGTTPAGRSCKPFTIKNGSMLAAELHPASIMAPIAHRTGARTTVGAIGSGNSSGGGIGVMAGHAGNGRRATVDLIHKLEKSERQRAQAEAHVAQVQSSHWAAIERIQELEKELQAARAAEHQASSR